MDGAKPRFRLYGKYHQSQRKATKLDILKNMLDIFEKWRNILHKLYLQIS